MLAHERKSQQPCGKSQRLEGFLQATVSSCSFCLLPRSAVQLLTARLFPRFRALETAPYNSNLVGRLSELQFEQLLMATLDYKILKDTDNTTCSLLFYTTGLCTACIVPCLYSCISEQRPAYSTFKKEVSDLNHNIGQYGVNVKISGDDHEEFLLFTIDTSFPVYVSSHAVQ